jgi:hypothetical protein
LSFYVERGRYPRYLNTGTGTGRLPEENPSTNICVYNNRFSLSQQVFHAMNLG